MLKKILFAVLALLIFLSVSAQDNPPATQEHSTAKSGYVPKPGIDISDIGSEESPPPPPDAPLVKIEKVKIPSGRDKVNAEVFYPSTAAPAPIVVLLHGSHPQRTDAYYDVMAQDLAMHGYLCVFPHYFERGRKGRGSRSEWMRTVGDAIDYAETLPNVDKTRVALVGYSLGSFLALGYAPTDNRITCLVAFYGGLSGCYLPSATEHMPPTLLIHGMQDRTVPARRSLEAFRNLRESQKPVSVVLYPNVGHGFTLHRRGEWDDSVSEDAWSRTLSFINYNLYYPAWTPEVPLFHPEQFQIALNKGEDADDDLPLDDKKLQTPYLDKMFDCGDKVYVDPTGEEFAKLLKQSQPPPRKKSSARKKIIPRRATSK
jgi:dienelactone hydrolase